MARIDESGLGGQTRDRPINEKLRRVLMAAAGDARIDTIRITSGGQPGTGGRRTGSHRHDDGNAADLELIKNGRPLNFTISDDLEVVSRFVTAAASYGANGIGAGVGYMGPTKLHVGFGNSPQDHAQLVWGAGGASANAPPWLREAAQRGWSDPRDPGDARIVEEAWSHSFSEGHDMSNDPNVERFRPFLDFIALHEVGTAGPAGYNISLAHGRFLPGGREQILVTKTLDEIDDLQSFMRRSSPSSALGRYQFVQTTLRGLRTQLGLSASDLFSQDLQDRLGVALVKRRGRNVAGLRAEWESLNRVDAQTIFAKFDEVGTMRETPSVASDDLLALISQLLARQGFAAGSGSELPTLKMGDSGDEVKRLQDLLNGLQYYTGGTDGKFGKLTRSAIAIFQLDNNLPVTGVADASTWAALVNGTARPLPDQRVSLTPDDLRKLGSKTVQNADWVRILGWITGALGMGGLGKSGACALDATNAVCGAAPTSTTASTVDTLLQSLQALRAVPGIAADPNVNQSLDTLLQILQKAAPAKPAAQTAAGGLFDAILPWVNALLPAGTTGSLAALAIGAAVHFFSSNIIQQRVNDQRSGMNIGPKTM